LAKALSRQLDEDVFKTRLLQADIGEFEALLVNPLHEVDERSRGPP
jgi:hypothetical protein